MASTGKRLVAIGDMHTTTTTSDLLAEALQALPHTCNADNKSPYAVALHGDILSEWFLLRDAEAKESKE